MDYETLLELYQETFEKNVEFEKKNRELALFACVVDSQILRDRKSTYPMRVKDLSTFDEFTNNFNKGR